MSEPSPRHNHRPRHRESSPNPNPNPSAHHSSTPQPEPAAEERPRPAPTTRKRAPDEKSDAEFEVQVVYLPPDIQLRARQQRKDAIEIQAEHNSTLTQDCPILCWMLFLNRDYTKQEYDLCWKVVAEANKALKIKYEPESADSFRRVMCAMMPILMMRHRRIPRTKWKDKVNSSGKHWIEMLEDELTPDRFMFSMIGYHLSYTRSLCGMGMTQGLQRKIINIGVGIRQIINEHPDVPLETWIESLSHKITPLERASLGLDQDEETILRRLTTLLALKESYMKAIGQPIGFDYTRLEYDIDNLRIIGDGNILTGWEFRIFKCAIGAERGGKIVDEAYITVIAFFRGNQQNAFMWYDNSKDLDRWVQFITMDQMMKVADKLTA